MYEGLAKRSDFKSPRLRDLWVPDRLKEGDIGDVPDEICAELFVHEFRFKVIGILHVRPNSGVNGLRGWGGGSPYFLVEDVSGHHLIAKQASAEFMRYLQASAVATQRLAPQSFAPIYGHPDFLTEKTWYFSPFVDGANMMGFEIGERAEDRRLSQSDFIGFLRRVLADGARKLDTAGQSQVAIRDIKPGNTKIIIPEGTSYAKNDDISVVFIDNKLSAKLTAVPNSVDAAKGVSTVAGTSGFIAPEACFGFWTKRSDTFSWAVSGVSMFGATVRQIINPAFCRSQLEQFMARIYTPQRAKEWRAANYSWVPEDAYASPRRLDNLGSYLCRDFRDALGDVELLMKFFRAALVQEQDDRATALECAKILEG